MNDKRLRQHIVQCETKYQSVLHTAFVSLGSNIEPRVHYIREAVEALRNLSTGALHCSPLYETKPVGYLEQSDFLNLVLEMTTDLGPRSLLAKLGEIEQSLGRRRVIVNGPRTIDLDILLFDNEYVCFADLQIPHPRMWERAFVLIPLADLAPSRRGLGGRTIADMAQEYLREGDVRRVGLFW